jgi:2-dehydro-3-deoxyphosphogluconate aldolase/(4S)-4-hydroxy-2-oxoglutarate aldolase
MEHFRGNDVSLPEVILTERVIPVVRGLTAHRAHRLAAALAEGGVTSLEVTMESGDALGAITSLAGTGTTVGAGTVMTLEEGRSAIDAGALFLVSPHFDPHLVEWTRDEGIPYLPGVMTPTEVALAISKGVTTVKLFPAEFGGPGMIRALRGPFPSLGIVPTGGITADNAAEFIAAGAVAVGVGSWLTGGEDLSVVSERSRLLRSAVGG